MDIYLGTEGNLKKVVMLARGYRPSSQAHDSVVSDLDGSLDVVTGVVPRAWEGVLEVMVPAPEGTAELSELLSLWTDEAVIILEDEQGDQYPVIWQSDFDVRWISKAANYAVVPVHFVEKLT